MTTSHPTGTVTYASIGARIGGFLLDSLFGALLSMTAYGLTVALLFAQVPTAVIVLGSLASYVLPLAYWVFATIRMGTRGSTPGQALAGVRVVSADTGGVIGVGPALLRMLVLGLVYAVCLGILGLVMAVLASQHPRRQAWHDLAVGSVVVPRGGAAPTATAPVSARSAGVLPVNLPPAGLAAPARGTMDDGRSPQGSPPPPPPPSSAPSQVPSSEVPSFESPPEPRSTGIRQTASDHSIPAGIVGPPPGVVPAPPPSVPVGPTPDAVPHQGDAPAGASTDAPTAAEVPAPSPVEEATQLAARRRPSAASWTLTARMGGELVLDGLTVVGRDPDPSLVPGARSWAVDDPERTVSKTHAVLGVTDGRAWVQDRSSTNGVAVRRDDDEQELSGGESRDLRDGDVVLLGDLEITVRGPV